MYIKSLPCSMQAVVATNKSKIMRHNETQTQVQLKSDAEILLTWLTIQSIYTVIVPDCAGLH